MTGKFTAIMQHQHRLELFYLFNLYFFREVIENKFSFTVATWQRAKLLMEKGEGIKEKSTQLKTPNNVNM